MKKQINYPIKVLKRRMAKKNYEPFALDCKTGEPVKVGKGKSESFIFLIMQLLFILFAMGLVYFTVAQPLIQTTQARSAVENSISEIGGDDYDIVKDLYNRGTVISKTMDGNIISLVIDIEVAEMREALNLAFSISTVKEVYTDGRTLTVTFLSSDK